MGLEVFFVCLLVVYLTPKETAIISAPNNHTHPEAGTVSLEEPINQNFWFFPLPLNLLVLVLFGFF